MIELFSAVFVASLLGSMHCAGMCGAFVALAVAEMNPGKSEPGAQDPSRSGAALRAAQLASSYNAGRLVTYVALGAIAGTLGSALNLAGDALLGVQRAAMIVAGAALIWFGLVALARLAGWNIPRAPVPAAWRRAIGNAHRRVMSLPPLARAGAIGLLTTLLPCGWLYAFVLTAAGTASPSLGALAMAAFWLGTLPIMAALGVGIRGAFGPVARHVPMLTALALVAVGVYTLTRRAPMPLDSFHMVVIPASVDDAAAQARTLDESQAPCCGSPTGLAPRSERASPPEAAAGTPALLQVSPAAGGASR